MPSHHPQEVLLAQFSLYVHKSGLKTDSFHFFIRGKVSEIRSDCGSHFIGATSKSENDTVNVEDGTTTFST